MKKILMIAYHYPPVQGSSGLQRTLKFGKFLPLYGWQPLVLSVHPIAYSKTGNDLLSEIPESTIVKRTFALDTARHLSMFGRYPGFLSRPDRWVTWVISAIPIGLLLLKKNRPQVIWSTYPIATAHLIGYLLHKITGIPWVADLRDPMVEGNFPADPAQRKVFQWIEEKIATHASQIYVTTRGTKRLYEQRYNTIESKLHVISNGYDEENFLEAEKIDVTGKTFQYLWEKDRRITLIHSGILYPAERNPLPFFRAVSTLKKAGKIDDTVVIIFRATGHDELYEKEIEALEIADIVKLKPGIDYISALAEMTFVDGLLLFQASICNDQIPAKLYEYIRAGKDIMALTDIDGDTADVLLSNGYKYIVDIDDDDKIADCLYEFIQTISKQGARIQQNTDIKKYSRQNQTKLLAQHLADLIG